VASEPTGAGTALDAPVIERPASTAVMTAEQFDSTWRMAKALAASGSFKDIGKDDGSKALARILLGADLGMSPTQALMGIDIVKGNPQIRGVALGRMVRNSARRPTATGESYDYAVLDRGFKPGEEFAVVALYRRDENGQWPTVEDDAGVTFPTILGQITVGKGNRLPEAVEAFVLDQAKKRNLVKSDGAWETQPEVMVVWRALSQLVRFYAPDLIGGVPVYTEADALPRGVADGEGSGDSPGWRGLSVEHAARAERVVMRARELGIAGLSNDGALAMQINGLPADAVERVLVGWEATVQRAEQEAEIPDAVLVGPKDEPPAPGPADEDPGARAEALEQRALAALNDADAAEADGNQAMAEGFREQAEALHTEAEALRAGQGTLGV
jgi:hypothetical protein